MSHSMITEQAGVRVLTAKPAVLAIRALKQPFLPNEPVTWHLKVSGGAHPKIIEIAATVVRPGRVRVLIEGVETKRQAWVQPENLTPRESVPTPRGSTVAEVMGESFANAFEKFRNS